MRRYAAFLRGISPMNAKMPALKAAFEAAGFDDVTTVLSSGNVVFGARASATRTLERKAEEAMAKTLGRTFLTIVRPVDTLHALLDEDPFRQWRVPAKAKRIVTFLRKAPESVPDLPSKLGGARIFGVRGAEVYTAYTPSPKAAAFMVLIERTFGKEVTTRTWDTVKKVARAGSPPT
jgi:uncharacterized protein (DUF1697 family)